MGLVTNASLQSVETPYFSMSTWVRSTARSLIEFGLSPPGDVNGRQNSCFVSMSAYGAVNFSFAANSLFSFEGAGFIQWAASGCVCSPPLDPTKWHHMALAVDMSPACHWNRPAGGPVTLAQGKVGKVVIDGSYRQLTKADPTDPIDQFSGQPDFSFYVDAPGFDITSYGIECGVPEKYATAIGWPHSNFQLADFQCWFNRFINWTSSANYGKVVRVQGGKGYPQDTSIATAAFGTPAILFRGKASDASFWINRGTGGTFTKTGTIIDFTPTPSYG